MKNNAIKSNYTIDEIHWKLYPKGDISAWDGLTWKHGLNHSWLGGRNYAEKAAYIFGKRSL